MSHRRPHGQDWRLDHDPWREGAGLASGQKIVRCRIVVSPRFGNDSRPLGNESWYSFEKLKRRVASACFELEECSLESRWVEPFVRRPYAHETGEAS